MSFSSSQDEAAPIKLPERLPLQPATTASSAATASNPPATPPPSSSRFSQPPSSPASLNRVIIDELRSVRGAMAEMQAQLAAVREEKSFAAAHKCSADMATQTDSHRRGADGGLTVNIGHPLGESALHDQSKVDLRMTKKDRVTGLEMYPNIEVRFEPTDETDSYRGLSVQVFGIALKAGTWKWSVKRIIPQFVSMHLALKKRLILGKFEFLPHFPSMEQIRTGTLRQKREFLLRYLNAVLQQSSLRGEAAVMEFLEVSCASFSSEFGPKMTEGFIGVSRRWWEFWKLRRNLWVVFKPSCFFLVEDPIDQDYTQNAKEVILFDASVQIVERRTGRVHGLAIKTGQKMLLLDAKSQREIKGIENCIRSCLARGGFTSTDGKPLLDLFGAPNPFRFSSFAPLRPDCRARWFVDGRDYFWAVSEAIQKAESEIFITDWWLSPELYLRRPPSQYPEFRLDRLLESKAKEGVKIFVLLYKEKSFAMSNDSLYSKTVLGTLSPNIMVQRSPDDKLGWWSHHEKIVVIDRGLGGSFVGGLDLCFGRDDDGSHYLADGDPAKTTWVGKDYSNTRTRDFENLKIPGIDILDRFDEPRLPWHDIHCFLQGAVAFDASRHFIQRWNHLKRTKAKHRTDYPFIIPKDPAALLSSYRLRQQHEANFEVEAQLLRSGGQWSLGVTTEHSIQNAYIEAIEEAQHFIYIENQFFISSTAGGKVMNQIGQALVNKILAAHEVDQARKVSAPHNGPSFQVVVVMPLLPGFPGDVAKSASVRAVMHWQYASICRGNSSVLSQLKEKMPDCDPLRYISFYGLRTHDVMPDGNVHTEQIYVHSKMMVVDDVVAIIGSANLNDRSMLGDRDSEVAVHIRDKQLSEGVMDGKPAMVGAFCHSLRVRCFKEHLGLPDDSLSAEDPVTCHKDLWKQTAETNHKIFTQIFSCVPDINVVKSSLLPNNLHGRDSIPRADLDGGNPRYEAMESTPRTPWSTRQPSGPLDFPSVSSPGPSLAHVTLKQWEGRPLQSPGGSGGAGGSESVGGGDRKDNGTPLAPSRLKWGLMHRADTGAGTQASVGAGGATGTGGVERQHQAQQVDTGINVDEEPKLFLREPSKVIMPVQGSLDTPQSDVEVINVLPPAYHAAFQPSPRLNIPGGEEEGDVGRDTGSDGAGVGDEIDPIEARMSAFDITGNAMRLHMDSAFGPLRDEKGQQKFTAWMKSIGGVDSLLENIRGHVVTFPLDFLSGEQLQPKVGDAELLVPPECFQ